MRILYNAGFPKKKIVKDLIKFSETSNSISIAKKGTKKNFEDPVIRFLQFKAFANPLYLSLQLAESREQRRGEVKLQWEVLSSVTQSKRLLPLGSTLSL